MKKILFALSIVAAVSFPAFACLGCKCADADKEPAVKQEETVQEKQSFDKCDAPLQMKIAKAQQEGQELGELRIIVQTSDDGAEMKEYIAANGGKVRSRHGRIFACQLPSQALAGLNALESVTRIEGDQQVFLDKK